MNIDSIMKRQERKEGEYINVFNEEHKHNKLIEDICFKSDMEIIDSEYNLLSEALDFIQEYISEQIDDGYSLDDFDIDDIEVFEFVDSAQLVYTGDLLKWLEEVGTEYTDRALEEYDEFKTTTDLLMSGYNIHAEKMFFIAVEVVNAIIEEDNREVN